MTVNSYCYHFYIDIFYVIEYTVLSRLSSLVDSLGFFFFYD